MFKNYLIFLPSVVGSVLEEWRQCLEQIDETRSLGHTLIKLNIFIDLPDYITYLIIKEEIVKSLYYTFKDNCPAYNITLQPPEKPWKVSVEAAFIDSDKFRVSSKRWKSIPYMVIESDKAKEIWACGLGIGKYPDNTRRAAIYAFNLMSDIIVNEQMTFNHIVRQWNYVGNILAVNKGIQNYQSFNEVRNEFYDRFRTVSGYPAATGVGMKYGGVIIDFCAIKSEGKIEIKILNNPDQISPYSYDQQVLKGSTRTGKGKKHPPLFERANLLINNQNSILFISGTAAIIGQETVGKEDVDKQTIVTIENINKLTDKQRIDQMTGRPDLYPGKYSSIRVYIKNKDDFESVKSVCIAHFPSTPIVFVEADICRDDLLMEMEAELNSSL